MIISAICYTLMAIFMKYALVSYSVFEIVLYRSLLGMVMMVFILRKADVSIKTPMPGMQLFRNVFSLTSLCLGTYVLALLPIGTAQTLKYTGPLFFALILVIESILNHQYVNKKLLGVLVIGFIGVCFIGRPTLGWEMLYGIGLCLICGFCVGAGDFCIKRMMQKGEPSERIVFWFVVGSIACGLIGTLMGSGFHTVTTEGLLLFVGIGISGTFAQYSNTYAYKWGDPLLNNIFTYTGVVFGVLASFCLFDEYLDDLTLIGCTVLMVSGILAGYLKIKENEVK